MTGLLPNTIAKYDPVDTRISTWDNQICVSSSRPGVLQDVFSLSPHLEKARYACSCKIVRTVRLNPSERGQCLRETSSAALKIASPFEIHTKPASWGSSVSIIDWLLEPKTDRKQNYITSSPKMPLMPSRKARSKIISAARSRLYVSCTIQIPLLIITGRVRRS